MKLMGIEQKPTFYRFTLFNVLSAHFNMDAALSYLAGQIPGMAALTKPNNLVTQALWRDNKALIPSPLPSKHIKGDPKLLT